MSQHTRPIRKLAIAFSLLTISGLLPACDLARSIDTRNLPEQFIIASIDGDRRVDAFVRTHRSPLANRQTWTDDGALFSGAGPIDTVNGPPFGGTRILGRGGGSPGIGSNGAFNVIAFWGRTDADPVDSRSVTMYVATSQDGVSWTWPVAVHSTTDVHSNTEGIVRSAGISVAPQGLNGPWFAAFADVTGTITIIPLPIESNGAIVSPFDTTPATIANAATNGAPGLSHFGGALVLAFRPQGPEMPVHLLTTTDGRAWPDGSANVAAMTGGVPLMTSFSAPYLHNALGDDLYLTTTGSGPNPGGRLRVHRSNDGVNFAQVVSFPVDDSGFEGGASAGPATELVVVYPERGTATAVMGPGLTEWTISTSTQRRVTIALGAM